MDILRHVITDLAPNRYIIYCQDNLAITTAYAGVWLFKVSSLYKRDSCPN